jgi:acetyltransferase
MAHEVTPDARGGLEVLAHPNSVAVIGASPDLSRYPGKIVNNLRRFNFRGRVYAVNPRYREVMGFECFEDIRLIDDQIDVALILVGAKGVPAAVDSAAAAGCRAAVVFASGMAEVGAEGEALQERLRSISTRTGIRILGPNCMGLVNAIDATVFCGAAALGPDVVLRPGGVAIAAQSGGVMGSILDRGWAEGIDFSYAFSTGNEADITLADCLEFLVLDERTKAIGLFIEAIRDVERFRIACEHAADAGKIVVALKIGRSAAGQQAASTHTAALTGNDRAFDALFKRLGVLRVSDLDELYSIPGLIANTRLPKGNGIAVACLSGGLASLSADKCSEHHLRLAQFSEVATRKIAELQQGFGHANNPLDITGQVVSKDSWWMTRRIYETLLADPAVDVLVIAQPAGQNADASADDIVELAAASEKPVVALWTGRRAIAGALAKLRAAGVPIFEQPDLCYRSIEGVLAAVDFRARWLATKASPPRPADLGRAERALRVLSDAGHVGLSEHEAKGLLSLYGINVPPEEVVGGADEAVGAAAAIGYPVAVKAHGRSINHKTDLNGVRLDLGNAPAVRAAYEGVTEASGTAEAVVTKMIRPGVEIIIGLVRDPQVGLLLLVGAGGTYTEILSDSVVAIPPLWPGEAEDMLSQLRIRRVLDGFRGRPAADVAGAIAAIEAVSQLASEVGNGIEQLDVNPLIVGPAGSKAWAADAVVVPATKDRHSDHILVHGPEPAG